MKLLTINDVIERVSFKKTKLYNWIKEGKFPIVSFQIPF